MPLPPRPPPGPGRDAAGTSLDRRRCRLVWSVLAAAAAAAPVTAVAVGALGQAAVQGPPALLVLAVLAAATLGESVMAFVVPGVMRRRQSGSPPAAVEAAVGSQFIVGAALGASAAFVASVAHFITGEPAALWLLVLPAVVLLRWFPSDARWEARRPEPAPGAPAPHRMVRG